MSISKKLLRVSIYIFNVSSFKCLSYSDIWFYAGSSRIIFLFPYIYMNIVGLQWAGYDATISLHSQGRRFGTGWNIADHPVTERPRSARWRRAAPGRATVGGRRTGSILAPTRCGRWRHDRERKGRLGWTNCPSLHRGYGLLTVYHRGIVKVSKEARWLQEADEGWWRQKWGLGALLAPKRVIQR